MSQHALHRELEALADTLWAERHVVEYLLFKLITAKLILAADERRFVTPALDEVERMVTALRSAEVRRASALATVARAWSVNVDALTLSELADRAPEPFGAVFRDHRDAFQSLASEIEATAQENRKLASSSLTHVQETIDALAGPPAGHTYTASGRHDATTTSALRLDEVL